MACFATPYGLRCAAHCFNRAHAQNNRPALIPAGGKLGVRSPFCPVLASAFPKASRQTVRLLYSVSNAVELPCIYFRRFKHGPRRTIRSICFNTMQVLIGGTNRRRVAAPLATD